MVSGWAQGSLSSTIPASTVCRIGELESNSFLWHFNLILYFLTYRYWHTRIRHTQSYTNNPNKVHSLFATVLLLWFLPFCCGCCCCGLRVVVVFLVFIKSMLFYVMICHRRPHCQAFGAANSKLMWRWKAFVSFFFPVAKLSELSQFAAVLWNFCRFCNSLCRFG